MWFSSFCISVKANWLAILTITFREIKKKSIEEALRTESEIELVKENETLKSDLSKKCEDLASITGLHAICEGQMKGEPSPLHKVKMIVLKKNN